MTVVLSCEECDQGGSQSRAFRLLVRCQDDVQIINPLKKMILSVAANAVVFLSLPSSVPTPLIFYD